MKTRLAPLFLFLLAAGAGNAAEVFTTTGSDGERVYTDRPVANAQKVELRIAAPRVMEEQQAEQPAFEELSRCEQARFIVRQYENASSLAEKTEDGGTRALSAEEAKAKIEQARADEERLCEGSEDE